MYWFRGYCTKGIVAVASVTNRLGFPKTSGTGARKIRNLCKKHHKPVEKNIRNQSRKHKELVQKDQEPVPKKSGTNGKNIRKQSGKHKELVQKNQEPVKRTSGTSGKNIRKVQKTSGTGARSQTEWGLPVH